MRRFFRPRGEADSLESDLRAARPEPRQEFVHALVEDLGRSSAHRPRRHSRTAFALSLSTLVVGTFASFGGLSYAASGAESAVNVVKHAAVAHHPSVNHHTSASAQYGGPTPPTQPTRSAVAAAHSKRAASPAAAASGELGAVGKGDLPFTGVSLVFTAGIGFGLLLLGLILRRRERRQM